MAPLSRSGRLWVIRIYMDADSEWWRLLRKEGGARTAILVGRSANVAAGGMASLDRESMTYCRESLRSHSTSGAGLEAGLVLFGCQSNQAPTNWRHMYDRYSGMINL